MNQLPKGLVHHLEYYMTEYSLKNYTITGGETTIISIRFNTASHIDQGDNVEEVSRQYRQYYRPKSSGAVTRDKQRQDLWAQRKSYDSGMFVDDSMTTPTSNSFAHNKSSTPTHEKYGISSNLNSKSEMNIDAKPFLPTCGKVEIGKDTLMGSVSNMNPPKMDRGCGTDVMIMPVKVDKGCQPPQISQTNAAVQSMPHQTSAIIQTAKSKTGHCYIQTLPIVSVNKTTTTDSTEKENVSCQSEQLYLESNQQVQTDPAENKHSQTEPPTQSSKCLMATHVRNQTVQTLTKKELKMAIQNHTAKCQDDDVCPTSGPHIADSNLMQLSSERSCNVTPAQPNSDPVDSDEKPVQPDPLGACAPESFDQTQETDLENVTLQDILDLLIKINNR